MKEFIFSVVWAAMCSWAIVHWGLIPLNNEFHLTSAWFFPDVTDFVHDLGLSMRQFCFYAFFVFFILTGLHKLLGIGLRYLIGIVGLLLLIWLVVSIGAIFLGWMAGTL